MKICVGHMTVTMATKIYLAIGYSFTTKTQELGYQFEW